MTLKIEKIAANHFFISIVTSNIIVTIGSVFVVIEVVVIITIIIVVVVIITFSAFTDKVYLVCYNYWYLELRFYVGLANYRYYLLYLLSR